MRIFVGTKRFWFTPMHIEERHWNHAQELLETILRVQTEPSPEAALHILVQHTLSMEHVHQGCLVLREPRTGLWKPVIWAGEGAVELFNPAQAPFSALLDRVGVPPKEEASSLPKIWVADAEQAPYLTAAPIYLKQRLTGLIACASLLPLEEEAQKNIVILAHISSNVLTNSQNARINKLTIEEKTKSDALRSNLIALSSHEMRTPLSVILGYADLLRDIGTEEIQSGISEIRDSGKSLLETVNTMTNLMDVLGSNAKFSPEKFDSLSAKIHAIESVNKIHLSNLNCNEIYCDINLIVNIIKIIADESSSDVLIVCSKENQGTRIDIETSTFFNDNFIQNITSNLSYNLDIDKFNQNSFISAFKITNIVSMHEGWITSQKSPTSEGILISFWIPDLPLSRFNY